MQRNVVTKAFLVKSNPFNELLQRLVNTDAQVEFQTPGINDQDLRLVLRWSSIDELKTLSYELQLPDRESLLKNPKSAAELNRLLSARAAEKVALSFYRGYKYKATDVSITQILPGEEGDHENYDIEVGEYCIDVKNARRLSNKSDTYVEHYIPQFKRTRKDQSVQIAGVLSPRISTKAFLRLSPCPRTPAVFLGVASHDKITNLEKGFHHPGLFEIDFSKSSSGTEMFFPAWVFDYPGIVYRQRDSLLAIIAQPTSYEHQLCIEEGVKALPIWLAAGLDLDSEASDLHLPQWQHDFVGKILQWRNLYGLLLPFLFLTVLSHFCEMVSQPTAEVKDYHPRYFKELLYVQSKNNAYDKHPLFIFDPLKTVETLISALCIMWDRNPDAIRGFHSFKLQSQGILLGRSNAQETWKTLLAYCGGKVNGKPCGKTPLVLGECDPCPVCGRLICRECGYCSPSCDARNKQEVKEADLRFVFTDPDSSEPL